MTISWVTPAGRLGIVTERVPLTIPLNATSNLDTVNFTVIAGALPRGLRLINGVIKGSPTEVRIYTSYKFVIRAADSADISDRTFSIDVDGSDAPQWITKEGFLNVGQGENFFVLDNAYVDYQLESYDSDVIAGDSIEYYLVPSGGELPPGLSLSASGRITGFTDPVFAVDVASGGYDTSAYDISYYDKAESKSNGFDSYLFDLETFDYNEPSQQPRRLSRSYTFIVGASDGANEERRLFRIWVVTDDFLKADNSILQIDTNLFRADNTSNRVPIWITTSNLGTHRANNYLTVYLDVYDPPTLSGTIVYLLLDKNPSGSASELPPGMTLDTITGEIAGRVPYQSRVSKTYEFTIQAIDFPASIANLNYTLQGEWASSIEYTENQAVRYNGLIYICLQTNTNQLPSAIDSIYWQSTVATADKTFTINIIGELESAIAWNSGSNLGTIKPNQPSIKTVSAESLLYGGRTVYELVSGTLPPGLSLQGTGDIVGKVKQYSDANGPGLTRFYDTFLKVRDIVGQFTDGGIIHGETSNATAIIIYKNNDIIYYKLTSEDTFIIDEEITYNTATATISSIDNFYNVTYDGDTTRFDKTFKFNIKARDTASFSELIKEFFITVVDDNTKTFANLYVKAFQSKENRSAWYDLITNNEIFLSSELYRYGDSNFGIQSELKVLIYAGIESVDAVKYIQAMSRNHQRKQLRFGDVKFAEAKDPDTQETIYEVIYVDVVDDLQKNKKSISSVINLPDTINSDILLSYDSITIDTDIPLVSDADHQRVFPNSFKNMRRNIQGIGERDRSFLPLWMRSIQDRDFVETGYVSALVLCYVKPGNSQKVISRLRARTDIASRGIWNKQTVYQAGDSVQYAGDVYTASINNTNKIPSHELASWIKNFNFKSINFTADRYIIDVLNNVIENKYLAFPQRGEKLP